MSMRICSAAWRSVWLASLPASTSPRVLELGCGTGLFSRHLLALSRRDIPPHRPRAVDGRAMPAQSCERAMRRVSFEIMDAARPTAEGPFDLIATSMTLHWLADPAAALQTLRKLLAGGVLIYAGISGGSFLSGVACSKNKHFPLVSSKSPSFQASSVRSASSLTQGTLGFLRRMKAVGGLTPREGYAARRQAGFAAPSAPPTRSTAAASPGTSSMGGWLRASRAPRSARHRRGRAPSSVMQ